jgi:hypothetical protein
MLKVIQIAAIQTHGALTPSLYVLTDEGELYERFNGTWKEIELPKKVDSGNHTQK